MSNAEKPFQNDLVVVTGAGSGIGRATALGFAANGARVIAADLNLAAVTSLCELIRRRGGEAHARQVDVAAALEMERFAGWVRAEVGIPDVVVNNAGIVINGPFLAHTEQDWQRIVGVNLLGVVRGCRLFGAQMAERGKGGHLVNIASAAAFAPSVSQPAYSTTKAAVLMLSECLRAELAGYDIGVSVVCPGLTSTPIARSIRFVGVPEDVAERWREAGVRALRRRRYPPEKVAATVMRAVLRDRAVVPVNAEAKAVRALSLVAPGTVRALARLGERRARLRLERAGALQAARAPGAPDRSLAAGPRTPGAQLLELRSSRLGGVRERANQGLEDAVAWDFSTEPEFQEQLDWVEEFCRTEVEPLDLVFPGAAYSRDPKARALADPLKQQVKERGLWALFLDRELGGPGFGQLKLALLNEILGRYRSAPVIFGTAAPDTGNMEMLAAYGTEEQKQRWLYPLMNQEIFSAYSMTEPQGGSDPSLFQTRAVRDGEDWVINGEKWFTSAGARADIIFVMCTNGMFVVPRDTAGVEIMEYPALHNHIRYTDVRVPGDHLLGPEDGARVLAQRRLGGGRIHHAMRTVAQVKLAFDMMCERALSRESHGKVIADHQMVQEAIAESYAEINMLRLLVLWTAWTIDNSSTRQARTQIAACKYTCAKVLREVSYRALHIMGSLGTTNLTPLQAMWASAPTMAILDGVDEVHKVTVARNVLKDYQPHPGLWPSEYIPAKREQARKKYAALLAADPDLAAWADRAARAAARGY